MFDTPTLDDLEDRFTQPSGWQWVYLQRMGYRLRYGYVLPDGLSAGDLRGVVVCLPGLSEFCEKYFELARDCLAQGLGFLVIDWRGQGRSCRYLAGGHHDKRHSQGFDKDGADLMAVLHDSPFDSRQHDFYMMAHSMGGNIGLRVLDAYRGLFKAASFCAPLVGLHAFAHTPHFISAPLTGALAGICGQSYAPFGGDWEGVSRDISSAVIFSQDSARSRVHNIWMRCDPSLRVGHVTYQWIRDAALSCAYIQRRMDCSALNLPCVIFTAGHETLVDNRAISDLVARCGGRVDQVDHVHFEQARHEIWMELDRVRDQLLHRFFAMVKKL